MFLTTASVQVFLGLALFSMQSVNVDPQVMIVVTMIQAAVAALTHVRLTRPDRLGILVALPLARSLAKHRQRSQC